MPTYDFRRQAARRRPTMEEQLERLNAPAKARPKGKPAQRLFGCEISEEGGEFVVRKDGVEVGRGKDRREAQEIARQVW